MDRYRLLQEKYESVMESRYFGRGGIEIVLSGQLEEDEIKELVEAVKVEAIKEPKNGFIYRFCKFI